MEILRFEDERKATPNRKKTSRSLLILGLVGALFGISTAFASSTIAINADNKVNLGQGVVTVSGCDSTIGFKPETKLSNDASSFQVTSFLIGYDFNPSISDADGTHSGLVNSKDCEGKQIKITLYKDKLGGGVQVVPCASTYNGAANEGKNLKETKVRIGGNMPLDNTLEYLTPFKCSSDGSFYYEVSHFGIRSPAFLRSSYDETTKITFVDQAGFVFNANSFDHVTIESVSGETGLSYN